ncbi:MAG: peptidase domain-containing ABC transporter, partial [Bacteroidota bacterium]
ATTGLNAFSEAIIMDDLLEYFRGTTIVVVAHRHSTIKQADQIIVLEGGEAIEVGSHEYLMDNKSVYRQIIRNQLELGN